MRHGKNGGKDYHFFPAFKGERYGKGRQKQYVVIGPKVKHMLKTQFYIKPKVSHFNS